MPLWKNSVADWIPRDSSGYTLGALMLVMEKASSVAPTTSFGFCAGIAVGLDLALRVVIGDADGGIGIWLLLNVDMDDLDASIRTTNIAATNKIPKAHIITP